MTAAHWHHVFYANMLFVIVAVLGVLGFILLRKRKMPEARPLGLLVLAGASWALMFGLEFVVADLQAKLFWAELKYLGIVMLPVSGLLFALYYTGKQHWLKPRYIILLAVCTLAPLLVVLTNEFHSLFWTYDVSKQGGAFSALDFTPAVGFWAFVIYAQVIILFSLSLFIATFIRSRGIKRKQAGMVIVSIIAPLIANVINDVARHIIGLKSLPEEDLTPFGLVITCLLLTWAIFRLRLGDLIPIAHDVIVEGMGDLIIVLDGENHIVKLNPAMESLINRPSSEIIGQPAQEVFTHLNGELDFSLPENLAGKEIALGEEENRRFYDARFSQVSDKHGSFLGKVVVLSDVTERKRMEQELIQHSRNLEEQVQRRTSDLTTVNKSLRLEITERQAAENALRESEERFRTVIETAQDVICTIDMSTGIITSVNNFGEHILGFKKEDVVNKLGFLDIVHPDDHVRVFTYLYELINEKTRQPNLPLWLRKADDTYLDAEINGSVVYDSDNNPESYVGIIRDVSDRKRTEMALMESEKRYRLLADNVTDVIWSMDIKGLRFTYFSPSVMAQRGYTVEEAMARPLDEMLTPASLETAMRELEEELAPENVEKEGPVWSRTIELKQTCKDGSTIWTEVTVTFIRGEDGRPVELLGVTRDITDRKQAKEELESSLSVLQATLESTADGILVADTKGNVQNYNQKLLEMWNIPADMDRSDANSTIRIHMMTQLKDPEKALSQTLELYDHPDRDNFAVLEMKDGRIFERYTHPRKNGGETVGIVVSFRDVSEQKRLQQQLLQAQKMESIGTLAGGIAHDFNNLLGGILGFASLTKTKISKDNRIYPYIDTIETSAARAAELTSQLLAFARGGRYEVKPVNLNKIVSETLEIIGRTFDKSIEIEENLNSRLPTVEADSGQLQQVIMNLCMNAKDAMDAGGKLIIQTASEKITASYSETQFEVKPGPYVVLSISDTGVGIDEEKMQRIFEPFFTTKEEGKGTGLGLSMVYGVVKNHGGFVNVYSELCVGTTFKVYLPASEIPEQEEPSETERPGGGSEMILVVDDDESIRNLAKEILEGHGYKVILAENGMDAVEAYTKHNNDIGIVILDMVMPIMGGREAFLKLKGLNPEVKAILSTGYSQDGKAKAILNSGVKGFIQKPYRVDALLSKVRSVLDAEA